MIVLAGYANIFVSMGKSLPNSLKLKLLYACVPNQLKFKLLSACEPTAGQFYQNIKKIGILRMGFVSVLAKVIFCYFLVSKMFFIEPKP